MTERSGPDRTAREVAGELEESKRLEPRPLPGELADWKIGVMVLGLALFMVILFFYYGR